MRPRSCRGHRDRYRSVRFEHGRSGADIGLERPIRRFPFVPNRADKLDEDCYEAFNIEVDALMRQIQATNPRCLTIGISGELDSAHMR